MACAQEALVDWDGFDFAIFLHDVMTSVYPFDFPTVFLEQIQQVFVFHAPQTTGN